MCVMYVWGLYIYMHVNHVNLCMTSILFNAFHSMKFSSSYFCNSKKKKKVKDHCCESVMSSPPMYPHHPEDIWGGPDTSVPWEFPHSAAPSLSLSHFCCRLQSVPISSLLFLNWNFWFENSSNLRNPWIKDRENWISNVPYPAPSMSVWFCY